MSKSWNPIVRAEWDPSTIPDQTGRVALVTGAYNPGSIGWQTALQLAKKGATVFLGARSQQKAQSGIEEVLKVSPESKGRVHSFVADLGDLKAVHAAATEFAKTQPRLDLLVNNAALLIKQYDEDKYGFSDTITVNHLGPFVLTNALLPLLKATAAKPGSDVRIVNVSSVASWFLDEQTVDFASTESFKLPFGSKGDEAEYPSGNWLRYGQSKLANVLHAKELQKRLDAAEVNITVVSLHPGSVSTDKAVEWINEKGMQAFLKGAFTPLQGALTSLYAATFKEVATDKAKFGGAYLVPFGTASPEETSKHATPELATQLWNTSEKAVNEILAA